MKLLAALALALALLVPVPVLAAPAQAKVGCAAARVVVGNSETHDAGNLLGGVHVWTMRINAQDCDGFDRINNVTVRMEKDNGRCSNGALSHINNYDFNPNSLGYWNPGTRTVDCNSGQTAYSVSFDPPGGSITVNSNDPENERCIGAAVQVDKGPILNDFNGTVPSVCFNGL